jgi:protein-disulfide isomerase
VRRQIVAAEKKRARGEERMKIRLFGLVATVVMLTAAALAAGDTSALHPPAGHRMALVTFEDLECPACAHAEPLLLQAARNYGIPLVWHDFIIPMHPWSKEAAIMARYFDTQSPQLGNEFRAYIFANQPMIYKANLREWADKFAAAHHTALPAFYDPTGKLREKVEADTQLGSETGPTGVTHTPTIYVVTNSPRIPYVEVTEQSQLFNTIEQVKAQLGPAPASRTKHKAEAKRRARTNRQG